MLLTIDPQGTTRCLYTEDLPLDALGRVAIRRASHVEPNGLGFWYADIIDGPTLGPFDFRSEALAAEVDYLERNSL
jgi:hypothetical protein